MNSEKNSVVRFVYFIVVLAGLFIILLGIQSSAYLINSLLLAALITVAVLPVPRWLIRRGVRPTLALVLSLFLIVGAMALLGLLVFTSFNSVASELEAGGPAQPSEVNGSAAPADLLATLQSQIAAEDVNQLLGQVLNFSGQIAAQFFAVVLIFVFMLSAAVTTPLADQLKGILGSSGASEFTDLTKDVQHYISITTLINFLVGLGDAILLAILGVPFAILWGILAWMMGYIPSVGFFLALVPPVLLAWVTQDVRTAAIVILGYIIINGSVENLVKPRIMGQGLNISPLVVFVSLFFWAWVLGGLGAILAVPLTLIVLSVLARFEPTRWITVLARAPASSEQGAHERREAFVQLRSLRDQATGLIKGQDSESEDSEG